MGGVGEGGSIMVATRAGLLSEDGSCTLLLLLERGGGEDPRAGDAIHFLHIDGGNDLDILTIIVGGHRRW
jgi:hypothetical protein